MIKSFIYLDEYKMYSLSSQIFEGITEYLISTNTSSSDQSSSQKGPVGSGRVLADIIREESGTTEKRYLHDYSYVLFEKQLLDNKQVLDLNLAEIGNLQDSIRGFPFIRIKGRAIFNDIESIKNTIKNFNRLGKALTHLTNYHAIEEARQQLEQLRSSTKDKYKKSAIEGEFSRLTNIEKLAKDGGLQQDQSFLDDLELLLSYGFQDQFEVRIEHSGYMFSANLKRESLKEKEDLLIRKYSRKTEVEFVIFGMVAQCLDVEGTENNNENAEHKNLKEALMNLIAHLTMVENTFTGRLPNEVVIDPIAVYVEL